VVEAKIRKPNQFGEEINKIYPVIAAVACLLGLDEGSVLMLTHEMYSAIWKSTESCIITFALKMRKVMF